jgi:hypothetical protein
LGTQGRPLQQLALEAQASLAPAHCSPWQRPTPTLSGLQVATFSQLPLQQSHEALQFVVGSLHTSPSGLQPIGFRQRPRALPGIIWQMTGSDGCPGRPAEPQQSPSWVQSSPTMRQPVGGWQRGMPMGP